VQGRRALAGKLLAAPVGPDDLSPPVARRKPLQGMGWRQGVDCVEWFGKFFCVWSEERGCRIRSPSVRSGASCGPAVQCYLTATNGRFPVVQFNDFRYATYPSVAPH
jgi:hypothetical protein